MIHSHTGVSTQSVTVKVTGIIDGIPNPVPLPSSDACKQGVKCPVQAKDLSVFNGLFIVPWDEPLVRMKSIIINITADNDSVDSITCKQSFSRLMMFVSNV